EWLEKEYYRFDYMINPYHLQPGLLLDVDITSIKRKKVTLDAMANVLNEFLHGVSKGFSDAAFASFSRRRSTVREDINQSFASVSDEEEEAAAAAAVAKPRPAVIAAPSKSAGKSAPKKKGVVDSRAKGKKSSRGGIAEL
ncbi:MAG: cytochrome C oxidase subunit II, partial [Spirochaetes bacterium]|nr:cytochrome C oxidase subunit II [Spirochaetota bacterium]